MSECREQGTVSVRGNQKLLPVCCRKDRSKERKSPENEEKEPENDDVEFEDGEQSDLTSWEQEANGAIRSILDDPF